MAKRIFCFWITGTRDGDNEYSDPREEAQQIGRMLGRMPVNIPVLGYPWAGDGVGIGEGGGVTLLSRYAKFLVPADWKGNLSVWTGLSAKQPVFRQKPPRPLKLDTSAVYVTFLMSDGDNLNTWYDYFPGYWSSPLRGTIPVAWTMGPSIIDLQAPLVDFYYSSMTDTDSFGAAVSGIGYIYARHYAAAYGTEREAIWRDFLSLTARAMQTLDQRWIWVMRAGPRQGQGLRDYAEHLPDLTAILADYGGRTPYADANYLLGRTAVFHSVNRYGRDQIAADIRNQIPKELPAFMHVFLHNWTYRYRDIQRLLDELPDNVIAVRPDELARLYREHVRRSQHSRQKQ